MKKERVVFQMLPFRRFVVVVVVVQSLLFITLCNYFLISLSSLL